MVYNIKFTNYSPTQWTRSVAGSTTDIALQNLTHSPGDYLQATAGVEQIGADQSLFSSIATGDIDLYCCWFDPATTQRFGVKMRVPVQVLGMGTAPHWYVMGDKTSNINGAPNWLASGGDPSDSFNWSLAGFKIRGTPTASHASLNIDVTVEKA